MAAASPIQLTAKQRASWMAHLFKAVAQQHHSELRRLFAPLIPADAVVVDIGAHAGQFSKLFARMAPDGHVHAFEPSAYARSIMAPALRFNRIRNVTLLPFGLGEAEGGLTLHTPIKASGSLGFGTAHLGQASVAAHDQAVAITTLDAYAAVAGLARLDLIKADIEGWELRALKGAEGVLKRFRPALYLEVDDLCLARAGDTPAGLFTWLQARGYQAFTTPLRLAASGWPGPGDYLFVADDHGD